MGKGDLFGWARLARATTLSSFRPCGTCPPSLRKPSASLLCYNISGVSPPRKEEEEEEEEEAIFIRGVNTNEDSPNAQHAQHRPVQDTGAMSA